MSTGLNCQLIESAAGEWYYVLEDSGAPKNAWDWRECAVATGPFPTEEACARYLSDHEANPGGYSVIPHTELQQDAVYDELLAPGKVRRLLPPRYHPRW